MQKALNIFNAALVTPTYYVFFTSATIITSAVLFQGFKGSGVEIATVVIGFLQICSGVVLLQLSKSAKDVPDAAVFKGDLDQVREVVTQEEPESEPKADSIRGTAAIIRRISAVRRNMEDEEARRFFREKHEGNLAPPAGNELIEWDGLRRRKTVLGTVSRPHTPGSVKNTFPPLGMSHFPVEDEHAAANKGGHSFLEGIRSRASSALHPTHWRPVHNPNEQVDSHLNPVALGNIHSGSGIDTSYHGAELKADQTAFQRQPGRERSDTPRSISWADEVNPSWPSSRKSSTGSEPLSHVARRQFSFNTIINRILPGGDSSPRSLVNSPRGILRRAGPNEHRQDTRPSTEEERLGLVQGDSQVMNDEDMNEKLERTWSSSSESSAGYGRQLMGDQPYGRSRQSSGSTVSTTAFPSYEEHDGYQTHAETYYMEPLRQTLSPSQNDGVEDSWQLPSTRSATAYTSRGRLPSASLRSNPLPPLPDEDLVLSARAEPSVRVELRSSGHSRGGSRSEQGMPSLPAGRPGGRGAGWRRNDSGSSSEAGQLTASGRS